jgi:RNA-directed DNA polymerase
MQPTPKLSALSEASSEEQLSAILDIPFVDLQTAVHQAGRSYVEIHLKKKDGTPRLIRAPKDSLKRIQRSILDKLLIQAPLPKCAYGFASGKSIIENAKLHTDSKFVLSVDIKDFFPSVHYTRVEHLFHVLGANPKIAESLTILTTYEHALPQGAPTSPYIAGLVLGDLDRRITILCAKNRLTYSRYFDDITISGGKRTQEVISRVIEIVEACGFAAHTRPDKLRLYGPGEVRLITGIEVENGNLRVPAVHELTNYIGRLVSQGMEALESDDPLKEKLSLKGKLVFISQVDSALAALLEEQFIRIAWVN